MGPPRNGVEALIAASIDGRTHNVFHRQRQLERLHTVFRDNATEIKDAITLDNSATLKEVTIEHFACVRCIKDAYYSLSPAIELENDYEIAHNRDSPNNRVPVGIISIEPINHTFFYSVIGPLSSAIAAGNCIVVLLERNLRKSNALLRKLLMNALEQDTISIVDDDPQFDLPASSTIRVAQKTPEPTPPINVLAPSLSSPVVAVVDRTANLQLAARELVAARFCFGGSSPYGPDLVLVNEFAKQEFFREVVQQCIGYGGHPNGSINGQSKTSTRASIDKALNDLRTQDEAVRVVVQGKSFAVVDSPSRQFQTIRRQDLPVLVVHSIRSIDDGIELINKLESARCSATYHFGTPETGQYLAHFIPSEISLINHVPRELLLGPAYPTGHPINLTTRYPPQLFTRPSPQFIHPSTTSTSFASSLSVEEKNALLQLTSAANEALVIAKRSKGQGIGFFEQGLLFNVSLILLGTLSASVAGVYYIRRVLL